MSDLKFYKVSAKYLDHLRSVEPKVPYSGGAGYRNPKPYIGIVLEVSGHKFLAPLTSYKPVQDKYKPSILSFKIHERGNEENKLGMISINNMIPVLDSEISELDIESQDPKYKRMLYNQYEFIKANSEEIKAKAEKLHHQVVVARVGFFVRMSCDFTAMIDASKDYDTQQSNLTD